MHNAQNYTRAGELGRAIYFIKWARWRTRYSYERKVIREFAFTASQRHGAKFAGGEGGESKKVIE